MSQPAALPRATPEEVGFDGERLTRVKQYLDRCVERGRFAGCAAYILRHGQLCFAECAGDADKEASKPMAHDTICRIYSMTKAIVSVATMMLVEEGKFELNDPLHKFLPAFKDTKVIKSGVYPYLELEDVKTPLTPHHLLTHTSGLTYGFLPDKHDLYKLYVEKDINFDPGFALTKPDTLQNTVNRLAALPLLFQPGAQWNYSYSTDVLGALVEVVSGQPLDVFCRTRILEPLGMTDTDFFVPQDKHERLAACYMHHTMAAAGTLAFQDQHQEKTDFVRLPPSEAYLALPPLFSGGGGMAGTGMDYVRFCAMLLNKGRALDGTKLLSRKTVAYMMQNHLGGGTKDIADMGQARFLNMNRAGQGFGLGFAVIVNPAKLQALCSLGACSWGGAASTCFCIDPEEDLCVVFMAQLIPSSTYNVRRELMTLVYQALDA